MNGADAIRELKNYGNTDSARDTIQYFADLKISKREASRMCGVGYYHIDLLAKRFEIEFLGKRELLSRWRTGQKFPNRKKPTPYPRGEVFEYDGFTGTWKEHSKRTGISLHTLYSRRDRGYPMDVVFGERKIPVGASKEAIRIRNQYRHERWLAERHSTSVTPPHPPL